MARIRTIKPEFFTSEQVVECSPTARLLFVGLWCFCDDGGVHPFSARRIKMEVFPGDAFSEDDILGWIGELLKVGLLRQYEANGESFLVVTGWRHQKIEKPTLKYPQPKFDDASANGRRAVGDSSPPEGNGRERKGREGTGPEEVGDASSIGVSPEFLVLWGAYPDRGRSHQTAACTAYREARNSLAKGSCGSLTGADAFLLRQVNAFAKSWLAASAFCPAFHKWLSDARYNDDPSAWTERKKPKDDKPAEKAPLPKLSERNRDRS